ncbi:acyl-CoA dehydrogenase family protein [Rhodococcus sp. B50]|uniref:acyl-CoA dehydrogenase family protein n=1 Tax=Rhodococcus sp. B50 TaxID=2682847 RepID=UPI001BD3889C|nr:acyl-CoA dehydrogenase family protein [Rhodococcus sp. B50]MBS9376032.1 (R)-benzylsuccinyl-CoA dehydrogenase [Rhodococcus sp. B50]
MWDFSTEPEFQAKLDWADSFVRTEVEPLDHVLGDPYDKADEQAMRLIAPLKEQVREQKLWACHLTPEHGGQGYGQVKLALLNEILGRSRWAPSVFGCQAPDSGNAEILAKYGTAEQKQRYLQPLLDGLISSCYSMTEPLAGADPTLFTTRAVRDGDDWVINGEKWFSSNARYASFFLVMAVTNDGADRHRRMSMFIVPAETAGIEIIRDAGIGTESAEYSSHAYIRYRDVRVPADHLLGEEGAAFAIAQTRLGGGRIHHGMRTLAQVRKAFDLMLERAVSRTMRDGRLADLQATQEKVADSWIDIEQFRLLLLRTAWLIDQHDDYRAVRKDIAAVKVAMPKVYHDVVQRAMHLHGALGISNEMPFSAMMVDAQVMAVADGPTEVHKWTLAKSLLRDATPGEPLFGSGHLPAIREAAQRHVAERLEREIAVL